MSFWENITSWWAIRELPNVKLVHFNALKADLPREMRAIANFLDIEVPKDLWPAIIEHCSFDYMKAHANKVAPLGGAVFEGGASEFMNKGVNGRWKDTLSEAESQGYEEAAFEKLGPECALWLSMGELS